MLRESTATQQAEERRRRWFYDEDFDLIVWLDPDGSITGFQLCYDKQEIERALNWSAAEGFAHFGVDSGEDGSRFKESPVLQPAPLRLPSGLPARFDAASSGLPSEIAEFVRSKLRSIPNPLS